MVTLCAVCGGRPAAADGTVGTRGLKACTGRGPMCPQKIVEYPTDGKQVWVTRTVRKGGKVIHKETYFSNYARITGITLVGR